MTEILKWENRSPQWDVELPNEYEKLLAFVKELTCSKDETHTDECMNKDNALIDLCEEAYFMLEEIGESE